MVTKRMSAARFKAECLRVMDDVKRTRREVIVTKHGKPVAKLVPIEEQPASPLGCMQGTAEITGDLVEPVTAADDWEANR